MLDDEQKAQSNAVTMSLARSFILIGIAIFAILRLTHIADGILQLQMFPVVLALIGVALLFSRFSQALSRVMVFLIAAGIIAYVLFGRTLGIPGAPDFFLQAYTEPVNGAASADITLDLGANPLVVGALDDPKALLSTQVDFGGTLDTQSSGTAQRVVYVHNSDTGLSAITNLFQSGPKTWGVRLSPTVPTSLHLSSNITPMQLDLSALHLTGLSVDGNTGAVEAALPASGEAYSATFSLNSGDAALTLPEGAAVSLKLTTNTGNVTLTVPADAAVQVVAAGAGAVHLPKTWKTIKDIGFAGNGTWQTANFDGSARQIVVNFQTGTGTLTVQP